MKQLVKVLCAIVFCCATGATAATADGLGVSYAFWMPGDNGKLSEKTCTLQAAGALTSAGFRHVDSGTNQQHPVIFGDKGKYQATVFCLGDSGTVTVVVMGPDQKTTTHLRDGFSKAWKAR